jgi:glycosyltransferase-like protein
MPRIALVTYSTKPRGGVVHTLSLADALYRMGVDVSVVALGDPAVGFFRPVSVPHTIVPAPPPAPTLEERVFQSVDALSVGLASMDADVFHTQDCIAARAAVSAGRRPVLRTVHHVDDFTTQALIDCQRRAIVDPDRVLVVSDQWRQILLDDYGVTASVVHNGVDPDRFGPISASQRASLRAPLGDRFVFLAVGGIEPRKGSIHLLRALASLGGEAVLVVAGGHSFQDYAAYREAALASLPSLGLSLGTDVVLAGTLSESELGAWYRSADALAFPSIKEGWGLAVLEAMSAALPVIATDIPVFREYLNDGVDALLVPPGDEAALAVAMRSLMSSPGLRGRLVESGLQTAARYTWEASARAHVQIYEELAGVVRGRVRG